MYNQGRRGLKKLGELRFFSNRQQQISDSKISYKSIKDIHCEFPLSTYRKIIWNLLIHYSCQHKEIALQNTHTPKYNFALPNTPRFSECEAKILLLPMLFPRKFSDRIKFRGQLSTCHPPPSPTACHNVHNHHHREQTINLS